jgi:hypothetical protein
MVALIRSKAQAIFRESDNNGSGKLDVREIYPAICKIFTLGKLPPPSYNDALAIMRNFDQNGDGLIDISEFQDLLLILCGMK